MERKQVVVIHGTEGQPDENWFPWLADQVRQLGHDAVVPRFPTPEEQTPDQWRRVFDEEVGALSERTVLVGHSLGVAFVLSLVQTARAPVAGAFLVSGFLGELGLDDFDPLNAPFFTEPFDWEAIKQRAHVIRLYNGEDDPYVPLRKGEELAARLGGVLTVVPHGGHLNSAAGFSEFDQLLTDLRPVLEATDP